MPSSSTSTSQRLLALLSLLQARRDWPARLLAQRLEVSERTVRRDVERLRELDYRIDATRGPDGGYRLGAGTHLPPLMIDDEQAIAIALSLGAAGALGAGIADAAERALAIITRTMPDHLARRIETLTAASSVPGHPQQTAANPAVLLRIGEAIQKSEELRFDYASVVNPDTEPGPPSRTEPHHLILSNGHWYVIGYSTTRDDWRIYRADRIFPRSHNGKHFTPRSVPGGDPAAYLSARFRGSTGPDSWPHWGDAILGIPAAEAVPYVRDGTVEGLSLDTCRVRMGSWSWNSLAVKLALFDATISQVNPPELASAFAELAQRFSATAP
ncbi:YafY family protein [Microbacterium sp.]|uniref:helix-turn-helix transcriptional regulator n=1 Tax=Microbacterium sp. TaxID=51671 RepID=UPI0025E10969|nr:WYL domain-containing protein [Microbacterium sp.]